MLRSTWAEAQAAFEQATRWFVGTVPNVGSRWDENALGEWTIRDLVGHTSRALSTVESYLSKAAATVEVGSGVEYFRRALAAVGDRLADAVSLEVLLSNG